MADYYSSQPGYYGMPDMSNNGQLFQGPDGAWYDAQGNRVSAPPDGFRDPNEGGYTNPGQGAPIAPVPGTPGPGPAPGPAKPPPTDEPSGGGLIDQFNTPPPGYVPGVIGQAPVFTPPGYTPPAAFKDPTLAEAQAEPGYQSAVDEGEKQVAASAAAKGILNSGGTLKDIYQYGANAATQNYQNVDNRARSNYLLNYQTQYTDPYQFAYKGASDAFAPKMAQYMAETGAAMGNAAGQNTFDLNAWMESYNIFRNRQRDTVDANTATNT